MTALSKEQLTNFMESLKYPIVIYNQNTDDYEETVDAYANLFIENDPAIADAISMSVVYPTTQPARYLVTDINRESRSFVSRGDYFLIEEIDV